MSISYTPPRLGGDRYARFVELALRYAPSWGVGYTSDGSALLFTAEHAVHGFGLACHDLEVFGVLLGRADRCLSLVPPGAKGGDAREFEKAARERHDLAALMEQPSESRAAEVAALRNSATE
ncbi:MULTISPECIES: hypothetical protein [Nocardiopsis]|uniref:hypothetical protein n=1 Tax=Nocardiopsis TaxID=2013 RepID=UPI0003625A61|nr:MULTISPECIES: hypothetical protein [Nocardiopsis]